MICDYILQIKDEDDRVTADWKFAATVVDRFLLWTFSALTVLSSCAIILSAPHIFSLEKGIE